MSLKSHRRVLIFIVVLVLEKKKHEIYVVCIVGCALGQNSTSMIHDSSNAELCCVGLAMLSYRCRVL